MADGSLQMGVGGPVLAVRVPEDYRLLPVEFCAVALRASYEGVMNLVESGRLPWAFDVAAPGAKRALVRVHRESFLWLLGGAESNERNGWSSATANAVVSSLLPSTRAVVTSTELMARLFCSHQHISKLIQTGELEQVGRPPARCGVNAVRRVAAGSVARFLARRVIQ